MSTKQCLLNVTICGGGNSAHLAAGYFGSKKNVCVKVFTRRFKAWKSQIKISTSRISSDCDEKIVIGNVQHVSDDPKSVISDADVIIIAAPVNAHKEILLKIKNCLKYGVIIGTVFAQGGFDWIVNSALKGDFTNVAAIFGLQNIPWLCRTVQVGSEVELHGTKKFLKFAAFPNSSRDVISKYLTFLTDINSHAVPNFLTITLTPSNQILHPARIYSIFRKWDQKNPLKKNEIHLNLYSDFDSVSAEWLMKLDGEVQKIKSSLVKSFPELDLDEVLPIAERIIAQYGDDIIDKTSLEKIISTNKAYSNFETPFKEVEEGIVPDIDSRLFWEDIPYGLCVLKNIAELLNIDVPSIEFLIEWHQKCMKKEFIVSGRINESIINETGAPSAYGIHDVKDLVQYSLKNFCREDDFQEKVRIIQDKIDNLILNNQNN